MPVTYVYDGAVFQPISGIPGSKGDQGDTGPAGPSEVSADPGNQSVLGSDSLIYTPEFANGVYLPLAGGVMSGFLTLNADPTQPAHAATKQYVDGFLPLAGGSMVGTLEVPDGTAAAPGLKMAGSLGGLYALGTSIVFQSGVDTGYRVAVTANNFQVTKNHVIQMQLNGFFTVPKAYSETTGDAVNMSVNSGGAIRRNTSAAKYKSDITDASYLKDIVLAPSKFYRPDDDKYFYGMVADPLAAQDSLLGTYGNTHELIDGEEFSSAGVTKNPEIEWELENYDQGAYNAIVAAKLNDMNDRLLALEP